MIYLIKTPKLTKQQISELSYESAKYFLQCFEQDGLDVVGTVSLLSDCCMKNNNMAIHLGFLRYCKLFNRTLPQMYMAIVANNKTYDYYCQELTHNLNSMVLNHTSL